MARDNIRNFCIIAHIDHGKSTLSDRILELTDSVDKRTMEDQILDDMELERERGITIKARAVTMHYHADDGKEYEFNLIDTPGHVDFQYEVSRSLAACEGAILVVDASQGVEAQTLANCYLAIDHNLEVVPILNKIDLPSADPDAAAKEVEDVIGLPCMDAPRVSAKMGINIREVLERVVQDVPAPQGDLAREITRDPYQFDFLTIRDDYDERELKDALMTNISQFLMELGTGFALLGREYRLVVGKTEQWIDLLFYHATLHCYVVIEVKAADFRPEYMGQLGTYVVAVNHILKSEVDQPTVGLLICKGKDNVLAQYAVEGSSQPIGISEYELSRLMPKELRGSLPTIEEIEAELRG